VALPAGSVGTDHERLKGVDWRLAERIVITIKSVKKRLKTPFLGETHVDDFAP
jgi:hypothetical protein